MAYTIGYDDDQKKEQEAADAGQPVEIAGGGPSAAGVPQNPNAPAGSASGSPTGKGQTTPQFQNLDDYVTANSGQNFGSQFAGKVQQTVSEAGQAASDVDRQFRQASDQATTSYDSDKANSILNRAGTADATDKDLQDWNKYFNAEYTGPSDVNGALGSRLQGTAQKAADESAATASEPGRFALLDTYYNRPSYSQGEKSLDSFLVGSDASIQPKLQEIQKQGQKALANVKNETQDLTNYASANAGKTASARAAARTAIGVDEAGNPIVTDANGNPISGAGAIGNIQKQIADTYTSRQAADDKQAADLQTAFQTGDYSKLTPEEASLFSGISMDKLYGVDPSGLLSRTTNLTQAQTATPEQIAKMKALDLLAGLNPTLESDPEAGSLSGKSSFGFDTDTLGKQVAAKEAGYLDKVNSKTSDVNSWSLPAGQGEIQDNGYLTANRLQSIFNGVGDKASAAQVFTSTSLPDRIALLQKAIALVGGYTGKGGTPNPNANPQDLTFLQQMLQTQQQALANINSGYGLAPDYFPASSNQKVTK